MIMRSYGMTTVADDSRNDTLQLSGSQQSSVFWHYMKTKRYIQH